jgi:UDP-N-acetyl-D-mannosaminuronate dehydrogenase
MPIIIIATGYVGLPFAISMAKHQPVICYDINKKRIEQLQKLKIKIKALDTVASKDEVEKKYKINLYNNKDLKKFKFNAIILAVALKNLLKRLVIIINFIKIKKIRFLLI